MPRSLLPREHGAYVQLAAPLAGALVAFGATAGGVLLAAAACLAFVANEPLLVVLGHRGKRMKTEDGARAARLLWILVPLAAASGIAGLVLAPHVVHAVGIVAIPAGILVVLAWRKRERTLGGELVAAIALSGASLPVAIASGTSLCTGASAWLAWAVGYAFTVVAVHRVIARHRRPATWVDAALVAGSLAVATAVFVLQLWAAVPLAACAIALLAIAPAATHLRAIGFVLVGASLASIVLAQTLP